MKEYLKGLYATYQELLAMSEKEVMAEYGDFKSDIIADIEKEIDSYENKINSDSDTMRYNVDMAFSSWESVNKMFV